MASLLGFVPCSPLRSHQRKQFENCSTLPNCCNRRVPVARLSSGPSSRPAALGGGIAVLAGVFINRVFFTPLDALPPPQSREDLLAVAAAATLTLYGLGRANVAEREQGPIDLDGVDVRVGFDDENPGIASLSARVDWAARSVFTAAPSVKSFALIVDGEERFRVGRFRDAGSSAFVREGGIVDGVLKSGERAYLADLKVVPVREVEFGFLPELCQSVLVLPTGGKGVIILGADRPRPLKGSDFGWLQALSDKLGADILEVQ